MKNELTIVSDREKLSIDLLRVADHSLPRVIRYMNTCDPFVGLIDGEAVAACLIEERRDYHDIVLLAVAEEKQGKGYGQEMLNHVLEHIRQQGGRWVEIGCGNAYPRLHTLFQKSGFRFHSIVPEFYIHDNQAPDIVNSVLNRDMVRFRIDLQEKKFATTGYDASGRTN